MAYAAGRHMTYNGKYYEKGQIVDVTADTLTRIESYIYTKTLVEVADVAPKSKKVKKEAIIEAAPVVAELVVEEQPVVEPVVEEEPTE